MQLLGQTVAHYRVLEELGQGAMGVVYKALDTKLDRHVALKFLPTEMTQDASLRKRFEQEARAASALDHPNICTIHEISETDDGHLFICMNYYDGETLQAKIDRGPLAWEEATTISRQIASGLAQAHDKGIVHRDVKPANVLLTPDGTVKILDFGLAKLGDGSQITRDGAVLGTLAYMAPEHFRGEPADQRADLWSLGVCLYQMISGRLPFEREDNRALAFAILTEDPIPVSTLRSDVPAHLDRILQKALARNPAARYADGAAVMEDLCSFSLGSTPPEDATTTVAWKSRHSIAVLPFANLSADPDQEYFCDGIAEELIHALTHVEGLHVAARASSFAMKGTKADATEIGQKLRVQTLLDGSVRKFGDRIRIAAQLINVSDGYHIWSQRYERQFEDLFDVQDGITQDIVQALKIELTDPEIRAMERGAAKDLKAYDFYLRGRTFFYQRRKQSIEFALQMFTRAIENDPAYARAYAGISDCYSISYAYFERDDMSLAKAQLASAKALQLAPDLAESHAARGLCISLGTDYEEAAREFDEAIRLNPQLYEAYYYYGRACRVHGKLEKALDLFRAASRVNPRDYQAPVLLGLTYKGLGRREDFQKSYERAMQLIEEHLSLNPDDSRALYLGAVVLAGLGHSELASKWGDRALSLEPDDPVLLYCVSCLRAQTGRLDDAVHWFGQAVKAGYANREWVESDPDLDPVRQDPRFKELVEGMNHPPV